MNVVSGVRQVSVMCPLLFLVYTQELFITLDYKLIGYAYNFTLMAVVPSPGVGVTVAELLNRDLGKVGEWCDLRGMKLNANKTMIIKSPGHAQYITSHPH